MPRTDSDVRAPSPWNGKPIPFGFDQMRVIFESPLQWYKPRYPGARLHDEGGVTDHTLANLRKIRQRLVKRFTYMESQPVEFTVGPNCNILIRFSTGCYIATGFGLGYGGEGPSGLATFLAECGFGDREVFRKKIAQTPNTFRGNLFDHFRSMHS